MPFWLSTRYLTTFCSVHFLFPSKFLVLKILGNDFFFAKNCPYYVIFAAFAWFTTYWLSDINYNIRRSSTSWSSAVRAAVLAAVRAARVVRPAAVARAWIIKVARPPAKIRIYDKWECPGATKATRGVLECRFCCSRTTYSHYLFVIYVNYYYYCSGSR